MAESLLTEQVEEPHSKYENSRHDNGLTNRNLPKQMRVTLAALVE